MTGLQEHRENYIQLTMGLNIYAYLPETFLKSYSNSYVLKGYSHFLGGSNPRKL